jgi:hypothetical protein
MVLTEFSTGHRRAGAAARFLTARDFAGLKPSASTVVRLALLVVRVNAGETPALL